MSRHGRKKNRLKPSEHVSENFARMLAARFVPTDISARSPEIHSWVPPVCAEFYKQWHKSSTELAKLKLETVADIARDAFIAEGGQPTIKIGVETWSFSMQIGGESKIA